MPVIESLLIQGGQLVKQEDEPTRWITIGGKKVPITPPKTKMPISQDRLREIASSLEGFGKITDTLPGGSSGGLILPDGRYFSPDDVDMTHFDVAFLLREKGGLPYKRTNPVMVLMGEGFVAKPGRAVYRVQELNRHAASLIDQDLIEDPPRSGRRTIHLVIRPSEFEWTDYSVDWDDYEATDFDIRKAIQQQRRLPEEMRRLSTPDDLLKISQAELDRVTDMLRRSAITYAEVYAPTFDDSARRMFREELESSFISGFKEILSRPGTGPKGTIGRSRMRRAITDMLYDTTKMLSGKLTYFALESETNAHLQRYLIAYEDGHMTYRQFEESSRSLLKFSYDQALAIGKRTQLIRRKQALGQPVSDSDYLMPITITPADRATAAEEIEDEYQYLTGFLQEARRRKEEKISFGPYMRWRGRLYSQALRGLEQLGVISELDPFDTIHWIINVEAEHCPDCIGIAASSPYNKSTLPTVPRHGDTRCLMNCQCHLEVEYAAAVA